MLRKVPLIYFHGVVPRRYQAEWPVYVVGDNPKALTFTVGRLESTFLYEVRR
jgi:hypothetical protein